MRIADKSMKDLLQIPGVGKSIAQDFLSIGIKSMQDLKGKNPETLYRLVNEKKGIVQDRCLLYVFRCAVYYASTAKSIQHPDRLKWWNWTDAKTSREN
ncbi:MAG TPA: helix-hairpin-helix domain-containing protein [Candidatus Acidoferrales bacterium]|nr:helix-hairpin-helix domain-containing protein [Candidatus Acidoferrales bacterium]